MRTFLSCVVVLAVSISAAPASHQSPLVIPAAAFHEVGEHPSDFLYDGAAYLVGEGQTVEFVAEVYLPGNATVRRFRLHALDNTSGCAESNVVAWLVRRHQSTNVAETMALITTLGTSPSIQSPADGTINHAIVDNLTYTYFVQVTLCSSSHRLYSVVIDYTE